VFYGHDPDLAILLR